MPKLQNLMVTVQHKLKNIIQISVPDQAAMNAPCDVDINTAETVVKEIIFIL